MIVGISGIFFLKNKASAALFSMQSITVNGIILSAIPADIDHSGPTEIIVVSKTGVYPHEKRWVSVYQTMANHQLSVRIRQRWEVEPRATMFEVGDIAPSPGEEIFYLTDTGLSYYRQDQSGSFLKNPHTLLNTPTIAVSPDAGSLPRTNLLADWKGNGQDILLLPHFKSLVFFERGDSGNWQQTDRLAVMPRAFLFSDKQDDGRHRDYSLHTEFRIPRIFIGDFNGDGLQDLHLSDRESLTVYLQQSSGKLPSQPSFTHVFPVRPSEKDADTNLFFLTTPVDLNNDSYTDVILTLTKGTGKFLEQKIIVYVFLNKRHLKFPFSKNPDQIIRTDGATPGIDLVDANADGNTDLLLTNIKLGFWKIVQNLVSKRVNLNTSIYLLKEDHRYPESPDFMRKTNYKLDLTHRISLNGTWPVLQYDFNGDRFPDLLIARDGKIDIFLNQTATDLFSKAVTQENIFTYPYMHRFDLNNDGLSDLFFYQKKKDGRMSILLNNGNWK
jgi:hypothetical protein